MSFDADNLAPEVADETDQPGRPCRAKWSGESHVYVIAARGLRTRERICKIGFAGDIAGRLRDLQIGCPTPLEVILLARVGSRKRAMTVERQLHSIAARTGTHMFGEWFMITAKVVAAIRAELVRRHFVIIDEEPDVRLVRRATAFWTAREDDDKFKAPPILTGREREAVEEEVQRRANRKRRDGPKTNEECWQRARNMGKRHYLRKGFGYSPEEAAYVGSYIEREYQVLRHQAGLMSEAEAVAYAQQAYESMARYSQLLGCNRRDDQCAAEVAA